MFGLTTLRNAVARLAANLAGLADTVADVNAHLRQRAALDGPDDALALPSPVPVPASRVAQDATGGVDGPEAVPAPPAAARNGHGRRKSAAAAEA
ncbi:MAG TPA: hypothetical protein VKA46_00305 [Gemmataceae bacterium]|nr:hypothetical protein [Gemmataceae bacterium]